MLMVLVLRVFPSLVGCCCRSASEIYFLLIFFSFFFFRFELHCQFQVSAGKVSLSQKSVHQQNSTQTAHHCTTAMQGVPCRGQKRAVPLIRYHSHSSGKAGQVLEQIVCFPLTVTPRLSLSNLWGLREAVMEDDGEIGAVFILLLLFLVLN